MPQVNSSSNSRYKMPKFTAFTLVLLAVVPAYIALHLGSLVVMMTRTVHVHYPRTSAQTNVILKEGLSSNNDNMHVSPVTAPLISSSNGNDNKLFCRLTKELSFGPSMIMEDQPPVICVTYDDDEEDEDFVLGEYLHRQVYDRYNFHHDDMFVTMTGVAVEKRTRTLTGNEDTLITVVEAPPQHARRMSEASKGNRTLAIVRVSTLDSELPISTQELREQVLNESKGAVNLITQFRAISFGKFQLQSNGVHDVFVNESILQYPNMTDMYEAIAAAAIQQLGVAHIRDLADKVMICHPPGHPGTEGRVAFAIRLGWRSHYKDEYCASLSITYVLNFVCLQLPVSFFIFLTSPFLFCFPECMNWGITLVLDMHTLYGQTWPTRLATWELDFGLEPHLAKPSMARTAWCWVGMRKGQSISTLLSKIHS
jgi:hypothetical protein